VTVLRSENIRNGRLDFSNRSYTDEAHYQERVRRAEPRPGDLVITREAPMGEVCRLPPGLRCCLGQRMVLLRPNERECDGRYLLYAIQSADVQRQIGWSEGTGSTVSNLRIPVLESLEIPSPLLAEQRAIAAVLGSLDDKIDLTRRMSATLEATARAIFKAWFVDFEALPVEAARGEPVAMVAEGAVPYGVTGTRAGWKRTPLGETCRITMGQSPPGDTYNEDGLGMPFYQGSTDFGFRFPTRRMYCTGPTRTAEEGDTLLSVRAPVGDLNVANERCCVGRGVAALRHSSGSSAYTYYLVETLAESFRQFDGEGTVFGSVNRDALAGLVVVDPPLSVVRRFEDTVGPIDRLIRVNDDEIRALASLRDTLLPKLLSGEVRVKETKGYAHA
jgi:type I restriction enzyme S subunit